MPFHLDELTPNGRFLTGRLFLRGWHFDGQFTEEDDFFLLWKEQKIFLSREKREDLSVLNVEKESFWSGFSETVWIERGLGTLSLWREHSALGEPTKLWERKIVSLGIDQYPWEFPFYDWENLKELPKRAQNPLPSLDIVSVVYQDRDQLAMWSQSIMASASLFQNFNVFIIDHSPTPYPDRSSLPHGVRYLFHPENTGFGAGCNRGSRLGKAEFILFLNPDAQIQPENLARLVHESVESSQEGFCGWEGMQCPIPHPRYCDPLSGETDWCSGACFLVRRDAFDYIGGFDENLFLYGEDVELSWRLRSIGGRLKRVFEAKFHHETLPGVDQIAKNQREEFYTSIARAYLRGRYWPRKVGDWKVGLDRVRLLPNFIQGCWRSVSGTAYRRKISMDKYLFAPHISVVPFECIYHNRGVTIFLYLENEGSAVTTQRKMELYLAWKRGLPSNWTIVLGNSIESRGENDWEMVISEPWLPFPGILANLLNVSLHRQIHQMSALTLKIYGIKKQGVQTASKSQAGCFCETISSTKENGLGWLTAPASLDFKGSERLATPGWCEVY